jgi:excisionase family DNA binding protein
VAPKEPLFTPAEAADYLGVSGETLRRWADERKIRHVRLPSGQRRYRRIDLDEVLTPREPNGDEPEAKTA